MLVISSTAVTVQDADCAFEVVPEEPIVPFTDAELAEAFETSHLTADQCVWMNEQGISWEIHVERR